MSWDSRDFFVCLVMVGWKDVVKEGAVDLSCLLICLRVSLIEFYNFCLTLSMILFTLSRGGGGGGGVSILYGVDRV